MENFSFQKQSILKTSALNRHCLAVLKEKKKEFMVVATPREISFFNMESEKVEDSLKISEGGHISCLNISDDLVFFAYGMHIAASTSNCKKIFDFDTNIAADRIEKIHVIGYSLWVFSGNLLNQFVLGGSQLSNKQSRKGSSATRTEDAHSHMFESKINDSFAVADEFSKHYLIILKHSNQIVCYENKELTQFKTESPPLTIEKYDKEKYNRFLVGLASGEILHLEISKKYIKQIWKVNEGTKNRINLIVYVKNLSFFVFKDATIEVWNHDCSLLGSEPTEQKYVCAVYSHEKYLLVAGTQDGTVTLMKDYMKSMKDYNQKNQAKTKYLLQQYISTLKQQLESLKLKAAPKKPRTISVNEGISVDVSLEIDYSQMCTSVEIRCDCGVSKIVLKGNLTLVKCSKIVFYGKYEVTGFNVYVVYEDNNKNVRIWIKSYEKFQKDNRIKLMVYGEKSGITYGVTKNIDLKMLSLHHRIANTDLPLSNTLSIEGNIKYFELNLLLNMIFNDFGPSLENGDVMNTASYYSILTKQKITVNYKNNECYVKAMDPSILVSIKQFFVYKSKYKNFGLNYSTKLNAESIVSLVSELETIMKPIEYLKTQYELLPGLMEIKNDQNLSDDLKGILQRSEEIKKQYEERKKEYELLASQLKETYVCYQKLREHEVTAYELDSFERMISNFSKQRIISVILS